MLARPTRGFILASERYFDKDPAYTSKIAEDMLSYGQVKIFAGGSSTQDFYQHDIDSSQ